MTRPPSQPLGQSTSAAMAASTVSMSRALKAPDNARSDSARSGAVMSFVLLARRRSGAGHPGTTRSTACAVIPVRPMRPATTEVYRGHVDAEGAGPVQPRRLVARVVLGHDGGEGLRP